MSEKISCVANGMKLNLVTSSGLNRDDRWLCTIVKDGIALLLSRTTANLTLHSVLYSTAMCV